MFLHDNSVPEFDGLLNSTRGALGPHPFHLDSAAARGDMIAFLKSLSAK